MPFSPSDSNPGKPVLTIPGKASINLQNAILTTVINMAVEQSKFPSSSSSVYNVLEVYHINNALYTFSGQTAIGIDVDCFARYFYWTDVAGQVISRAKLDGTDSEVLVSGN